MPVTELNHYFVRANDLERSRSFYCDVLGFEVMPRPDFPFPGYWLGVAGKVQVHMGPHGIPNSDRYYLGSTAASATDNAGVVDHIAFLATDPKAFADRFAALGLKAHKRYLPAFRLFQLFVQDPDGRPWNSISTASTTHPRGVPTVRTTTTCRASPPPLDKHDRRLRHRAAASSRVA